MNSYAPTAPASKLFAVGIQTSSQNTFVILVVVIRLVYIANEDKFSRYFVSSQQERMKKFKGFIARIPQYTSSKNLQTDLQLQLKDFFNAEEIDFE